MKTIKLNEQASIPVLGFGTWQLTGEDCIRSVEKALETGFRHIDTADRYGNHREVGVALSKSGIKREELFITSKIFPGDLKRDQVIKCANRFLNELKTNYLDLLLVHWPDRSVPFSETLEGLQKLKEDGVIEAIGVSNFNEHHITDALATGVEIVLNQVELHPTFKQHKLKEFCGSKSITLTAYSPLGRGGDLQLPLVRELANKYEVSEAQVIINWIISRGIVAIPKSNTPERIVDNFKSISWQMDEEDVRKMNSLPEGPRLLDPPFGDFDY